MSEHFDVYRQEALILGLTGTEIRDYIRSQQDNDHTRILELRAQEKELALKQKQLDKEIELKEKIATEDLLVKQKQIECETQRLEKLLNEELLLKQQQRKQAELELQCRNKSAELEAQECQARLEALKSDMELKARTQQSQADFERLKLQEEIKKDLRVAEIQSSRSENSMTSQDLNRDSSNTKNVINIPALKSTDREDIEKYLSHFERICLMNEIPIRDWTKILSPKLPPELASILDRLSIEEASNYECFRKSVFSKYILDGEYFKSKFYTLHQEQGESSSEFFRRLAEVLMKWIDSERITHSFDDLFDFLLVNQYMRKLNIEKTIFIKERSPKNINELCNFSDLFDKAHTVNKFTQGRRNPNSSHNFGSNERQTNVNYSYNANSIPTGGKIHNVQSGTNPFENTSKPKEKVTCNFCSKVGHTENTCYAKLGRPQLKGAVGPQPSSTPLQNSNQKKRNVHTAAAMQIVEPSEKSYLIYENSKWSSNQSLDSVDVDVFGLENRINLDEYSHIDFSEEPTIMGACHVENIRSTLNNSVGKLNPYSEAFIEDSCTPIQCLRDTGSFISIIKSSLIPNKVQTGKFVKIQFANGAVEVFPTTIIKVKSKFFTGLMEVAILNNPVADLILGNMEGVKTCFSDNDLIKKEDTQLVPTKCLNESVDNVIEDEFNLVSDLKNSVNNETQILSNEKILEEKTSPKGR